MAAVNGQSYASVGIQASLRAVIQTCHLRCLWLGSWDCPASTAKLVCSSTDIDWAGSTTKQTARMASLTTRNYRYKSKYEIIIGPRAVLGYSATDCGKASRGFRAPSDYNCTPEPSSPVSLMTMLWEWKNIRRLDLRVPMLVRTLFEQELMKNFKATLHSQSQRQCSGSSWSQLPKFFDQHCLFSCSSHGRNGDHARFERVVIHPINSKLHLMTSNLKCLMLIFQLIERVIIKFPNPLL